MSEDPRLTQIRERWSKVRYDCGAADENSYADDVGYLLSLLPQLSSSEPAELHGVAECDAAPQVRGISDAERDTIDCMIASEPVLAREWDTPAEDEAWKDLGAPTAAPVIGHTVNCDVWVYPDRPCNCAPSTVTPSEAARLAADGIIEMDLNGRYDPSDPNSRKALIAIISRHFPPTEATQPAGEARSCPCLFTKPCDSRCTCVEPFSSRGCMRCCAYGSPGQQKANAERLASARADAIGEAMHAVKIMSIFADDTTGPKTVRGRVIAALESLIQQGESSGDAKVRP